MINILVVYDEQDRNIGYYCEACKLDLEQFLNAQENLQPEYISAERCNHAYVSSKLNNHLGRNFIFVAYSHGHLDGTSLLCNQSAYVDRHNAHLLANSLVYAVACSSGLKLGLELIDKGCQTFIGFKQEILVVQDYQEIARRCENWALMLFLGTDINIGNAFENMKNEFTRQIDRLAELDFGNTSWLVDNRNSLVLYGNRSLTRQDFA